MLWGTVGPKKMWGVGGQYVETLVGFPLGVVVVVLFWWLGKKYPRNKLIRNTHPVVIFNGGLIWAPYNFTYIWPAVPVGWFSWVFLKNRYLGLWSKVSRNAPSACVICTNTSHSTTLSSQLPSPQVSPSRL